MKKSRNIRVGDDDWQEIRERSAACGETITDYVLRKALEQPDRDRQRLHEASQLIQQALDVVNDE